MKTSIKITKSPLLAEMTASYKSKINKEDRVTVTQSKDIYNYFVSVWNDDRIEYVEDSKVILLNKKNEILGWVSLSGGCVDGVMLDKKVIFQHALLANASSVILAHNHPSGNTTPSEQDITVTKDIIKAGKIIGINVLDHIIVTTNGYTSLMDQGCI